MVKFLNNKILPILMAVLLLVAAFPISIFAADTEEISGVLGDTASCNIGISSKKTSMMGSVSCDYSDGATVNAKAVGGKMLISTYSATNTITITNKSGKKAQIKFDYSVENASSLTIGGVSYSGSGTYTSSEIDANATLTVVLTSNKNSTASLKLSNFVLLVSLQAFNVTVKYNSELGSVKFGDANIESGYTQEVVSSTGAVLTATPANGATFLGWVNTANNEILSLSKSATITPDLDITVEAIFVNSSSKSYFMVQDKYLFDDLNVATTKATSLSNKTVVLMNSAVLYAGDYTIPAGVTLLIPFDSANTLYTTEPGHDEGTTDIKPYPYRTLNLSSGANITVNGAISLSAKHREAQGSGFGCENSGAYGCINMAAGSNIIVNNGATLYAWGYIIGDGSVVANSGATVYEYFQFRDFRGGSISSAMEEEYGVFLFSQYYVQNIEVPLTLYAGAIEKTFVTITMSKMDFSEDVTFIGSSDAMFTVSDGYVTKRYDGSTDRLIVESNGDISVDSITFSIGFGGDNGITGISKDTAKYELPITNNLTVIANSGKASLDQDLALLPGSEIIVRKDAICTLGDGVNIYAYDADDWGTFSYSKNLNHKFLPLRYAPSRTYTRTEADLADAKIQVDGIVDASAGYVYTTAGGANIFSTGNGKVITVAGTQTATYQFVQGSDYTAESNIAIPITPAKIKNADGSFIETSSATTATTYIYNATHGKWDNNNHTITEKVTAPTCSEKGFTTYTCTCGYSYEVDGDPATGHSFDEGKVTTEPTCEAEGVKTYTCACGETKTEVIPATGHKYNAVVTEPTCAEKGYTTYTCANCSHSYVSDETEATGHIPGAEPTCTEDQTCTACGDVIVKAHGHSFMGEWIIETLPTYSVDGCKYHICEVCKEKGDITVIAKHTVPDINSDGTLSAADLVRLKKIVLGIDLVETDVDKDIYETIIDLNDDGKYNIMDLIKLKRIMLDL